MEESSSPTTNRLALAAINTVTEEFLLEVGDKGMFGGSDCFDR